MIDHEYVHRSLCRFQLQAYLLLDGPRRGVSIEFYCRSPLLRFDRSKARIKWEFQKLPLNRGLV